MRFDAGGKGRAGQLFLCPAGTWSGRFCTARIKASSGWRIMSGALSMKTERPAVLWLPVFTRFRTQTRCRLCRNCSRMRAATARARPVAGEASLLPACCRKLKCRKQCLRHSSSVSNGQQRLNTAGTGPRACPGCARGRGRRCGFHRPGWQLPAQRKRPSCAGA